MELPKKRGPKSKKHLQNVILTDNTQIDTFDNKNEGECENNIEIVSEKIHKKRGRKPKGGKIINANDENIIQPNEKNDNKNNFENKTENSFVKPNIILHLKCFISDLDNSNFSDSLYSFNFSKDKLCYQSIVSEEKNDTHNYFAVTNDDKETENSVVFNEKNNNNNKLNKEIHKKLKQLELSLHLNNNLNKKSCCFWCTCDFDNPAVYIPKYYLSNSYNVYGCFCSPECACAFLMEENIDNASKFERYNLLNYIYTKIYNYNKNIKPAPNPHYTLSKYFGNLNIQEYRALLENERLFLVVDKPLTRIMPELIEDNDEYILNKKLIPCNSSNSSYQIKTKIQKKNQTKNKIINEKFGISE